jgi:hypothetical protein
VTATANSQLLHQGRHYFTRGSYKKCNNQSDLAGIEPAASASTYKDFSLQQGNIGPCKEFTRKRNLQGNGKETDTKIKGNCKDFCNLYHVTSLKPVKINL